jgi:hypothetical protein
VSASTVWRPTENAAIGRTKPRALAALGRLQELLAYAIRIHDHCAANLLRHAVARVQASAQVGA